jgi:hypothetical protein
MKLIDGSTAPIYTFKFTMYNDILKVKNEDSHLTDIFFN